jgi:acyl-homoserine-lactone acylase
VVPDVDAEQLQRCAPSAGAAGLFEAAGLVVLDGSSSDCNWQRDPDSPVPGLTPFERMPVVVRRDWVQNSNDSYWLTNPDIDWRELSPLIGPTGAMQRLRTRAALFEIRDRLSAGDGIAAHDKIGPAEVQVMLFQNRNHAAYLVMDDLLELCEQAITASSREGCATLAAWDRRNNLESRGAHLFREWWRAAGGIENVWRVPFDPAAPMKTPRGLRTGEPRMQKELLALLDTAVETVRSAGFAIDAPLGDVQMRKTGNGITGLHGGDEFEGVLNKVETQGLNALGPDGYRINFGTSYVQTVTFDERGPVAQGILTYGQSTQPGSAFAFDQLPLYSTKEWPVLPFHPDRIARERVGEIRRLTVD